MVFLLSVACMFLFIELTFNISSSYFESIGSESHLAFFQFLLELLSVLVCQASDVHKLVEFFSLVIPLLGHSVSNISLYKLLNSLSSSHFSIFESFLLLEIFQSGFLLFSLVSHKLFKLSFKSSV